jgi:outer membrane protein assembly factor BamB
VIGYVSTIAGTILSFGDGFGTNAMINGPLVLSLSTSGKLYFSDNHNNRVRILDTTGAIIENTTTSGLRDVLHLQVTVPLANTRQLLVPPTVP